MFLKVLFNKLHENLEESIQVAVMHILFVWDIYILYFIFVCMGYVYFIFHKCAINVNRLVYTLFYRTAA